MTPVLLLFTAVLAGGVWLTVQAMPTPGPPPLRDRVLPYLGRTDRGWRAPRPDTSDLSSTVIRRLAGHVSLVSGGDSSVRRRLDALADQRSVEQFRVEQVLWAAGFAAGAFVLALLAGSLTTDLIPVVIGVLLAAITGLLSRDRFLTKAVEHRRERLRVELPTVIEMVAMSVGAGSGLLAGLERVSHIGQGAASTELSRVVADTRSGLPLVPALRRMADRNDVHELRRFVDSVVVAVERGTPLADVLVAQAADAREAGRRALIESGGRKEIAMMVPIVFLVLPLSVVFVLFPGFYGLQLGS
jgi:tight adherence protein C